MTDAEALAKNLGIRYEVLPIEPVFLAVEKQLEKVFAGTKPNEAEENVQSRLRGVTLMALSNKFGALVLTTGNKSEMAVGYCTLYGDMNGALAPIADVFKTDIYKIARWVNREKISFRENSISKPPSAELRPNQTDQDSLPPYETLDAILDLYVVKNLGQPEIVARGFDAAMVNDVVNKINFSEYKRRQAAPGIEDFAARVRHGPADSHRAKIPRSVTRWRHGKCPVSGESMQRLWKICSRLVSGWLARWLMEMLGFGTCADPKLRNPVLDFSLIGMNKVKKQHRQKNTPYFDTAV